MQNSFSLPVLDNKNVPFLLVQGGHLSKRGGVLSCFQEEKGRAECFSYIYCFSSDFNLKIILMLKWHILKWIVSHPSKLMIKYITFLCMYS